MSDYTKPQYCKACYEPTSLCLCGNHDSHEFSSREQLRQELKQAHMEIGALKAAHEAAHATTMRFAKERDEALFNLESRDASNARLRAVVISLKSERDAAHEAVEALRSALNGLINKSNIITSARRHKVDTPPTAYDRLYEAQMNAEEVTNDLALEKEKQT